MSIKWLRTTKYRTKQVTRRMHFDKMNPSEPNAIANENSGTFLTPNSEKIDPKSR